MGLAIVRKLRARGDQVRSFSRGTYPALEGLGAESVRGDIADKAAVLRAPLTNTLPEPVCFPPRAFRKAAHLRVFRRFAGV